MVSQDDQRIDELLGQVSRTARKLSHLRLNTVQVEILRELMSGQRTISELTLGVYKSRYTDEGYETYHSRIIRAVKSLERRGYISKKRLLGRDRPYGLTRHGVACIASIAPKMAEPRVPHPADAALFFATAVAALAAWRTLHPAVASGFTFLLGMAVLRAATILRRIM